MSAGLVTSSVVFGLFVTAACATPSDETRGAVHPGWECPTSLIGDANDTFLEDPGDAAGCYDVIEQDYGMGSVHASGDLRLLFTRILEPHRRLENLRCGRMDGATFVDDKCPDELAARGYFASDGRFAARVLSRVRSDDVTWSQTADGHVLLSSQTVVVGCFSRAPDGFAGLTLAADHRLANRAELHRRQCDLASLHPAEVPGSSPPPPLALPPPRGAIDFEAVDIQGPALAAAPECIGLATTTSTAGVGCYAVEIGEASGRVAGSARVLRLSSAPAPVKVLRFLSQHWSCLATSASGLRRTPCPVFALNNEFFANANVLMNQREPPPQEDGTWANTIDSQLTIGVGYGFVGAHACVTPTDEGFAGRVVQWSDEGGWRDPRPLTLRRIECPPAAIAPPGGSK